MVDTESIKRRTTLGLLLATICLCAGVLLVLASVRPVGASANAREIGQGWCDAWNSHSVDRVVAVFTDDVFYEDVPFGLTVHGSAELRDFANFFFTAVPDLHLECNATALHDGHGDIEWTLSGTDAGIFQTGETFSVRGTTIIDVDGRKISRNSDYYDLATIMRQVGILPPAS